MPKTTLALIAVATLAPVGLDAQQLATLFVEETAGIRRTQFPARAVVDLRPGELTDPGAVRLAAGDTAVHAQGTLVTAWDDGSVRRLEVDFNVSMGPFESRALGLIVDDDDAGPSRGLSVTEEPDGLQVGRVRFGRTGAPLLASVAYREELIVDGPNGVALVDDAGVRYGASRVDWGEPRILKPGPLTVHLRYSGDVTLPGGGRAGVTLDAVMPNSKSWVKLTVTVEDPARRVRGVSIETPLGLGDFPWTWDFGTPNATYGAFRNENGAVVLEQTTTAGGQGAWTVRTGAPGQEQPYEASGPGRGEIMRGWAHLQSGREAVAFAIEGVGERAGTFTASLGGDGRTSFGFAPNEPAGEHSLTVYQHYVSTPVPIGAATSPASILSPLRVRVD